MNATNLALRLLLELAALGGLVAPWPRTLPRVGGAVCAVILLLVVMMTLRGGFAVPDGPNRSGNTPVRVPSLVRLGHELVVNSGGGNAFHYAKVQYR